MNALSEEVRGRAPRKICIIKPSSLGDIVHSLPILSILRDLLPSSQISWVVNSAFSGLLEDHPLLDRVIAFDRGGSGVSARGTIQAARLCGRLLEERYDLTIDLQGLLRSGLMTAATRAAIRVGMADAREGAAWFYTHHVDASRRNMHAVDRIGQVARALGVEEFTPRFDLPVTGQDVRWAVGALAAVPKPRLVLNLGARWITKRWPPEHFAEIGRRAATEFGAGLVAVGSASDRPLADELQRHLDPLPVLDLNGRTTLLQLAALARESDLFISNDTGPLHLAAAAGAHVVGIFTCTDPRLTGPYGPRASTVRSCVWCAPSFLKTCNRLDCLAELSPDRVWPIVRKCLGRILESAA